MPDVPSSRPTSVATGGREAAVGEASRGVSSAQPAAAPVTPGTTRAIAVRRFRAGRCELEEDMLAVESPLEIRLGPRASTVLLRTPGHDRELVFGFLYAEGIIGKPEDVLAFEPLPAAAAAAAGGVGGEVVAVTLSPGLRDPAQRELVPLGGERRPRPPAERLFYASSACGACGKTSLEALAVAAPPVTARLQVAAAMLTALPERLRAAQTTFAATGGLHGAGLFLPDGELLAAREDVGRHNAVDKLLGWALGEGRLPLAGCVLQVSGRLGYEIVQKAIVAGIPLVAAVGAGSTLAIDLAVRYGLTVATFVREGGLNLYGDASRVAG
jgi:FdhD protein